MAKINLVRVDFRLIHGQVVNKWIKIADCNKIIVVEDNLAANDFMKSVYVMAAPPGVDVEIYSVDEAIEHWESDEFGSGKVLLLFKTVEDAAAIFDRGLEYKELQIGGLGAGPGKTLVYGPIALNKEEADILTELNKHIRVYFHQVPDDPSAEYDKVMNKIKF